MSAHLNCQSFSDCLHSTFLVRLSPETSLPVQLTSIAENVDNPRLEQFCLYFRGPVSPILAQCTHTLEHEKLGVIQLFIVPIGLDAEGARYEVVFNRIRPVSVAGSR